MGNTLKAADGSTSSRPQKWMRKEKKRRSLNRQEFDRLLNCATCGDTNGLRSLLNAPHLKPEVCAQSIPSTAKGRSPESTVGGELLWIACKQRRVEVVRCLCQEFGLSPSFKFASTAGECPLHISAYFGHTDLVRLLVAELSVPVNLRNDESETALHYAASPGTALDVSQCLLEELGAAHNLLSVNGETPLYNAVVFGNVETSKYLLQLHPEAVWELRAPGSKPLEFDDRIHSGKQKGINRLLDTVERQQRLIAFLKGLLPCTDHTCAVQRFGCHPIFDHHVVSIVASFIAA